jgi:phage replication O-like protein O
MKREIEYEFTPVPNETIERLTSTGLTAREFRIILALLRKTIGWNKTSDRIPLSQFSKMTGLDRGNCHTILKRLVQKRIIKKSVVTSNNRRSIHYGFNDIFSEWRVLSPVTTGVKRQGVVTSNDRVLSPVTTKVLLPVTTSKETQKKLTKKSEIKKSSEPGTQFPKDCVPCPMCGQQTSSSRINTWGSCENCFKPVSPGRVKELIKSIGLYK